MIEHKSLLPLLKFCEENEISVVFWFGPQRRVIGVPKYEGVDIDVGEVLSVGGERFALHDFKSILLINPDNNLYREHYSR